MTSAARTLGRHSATALATCFYLTFPIVRWSKARKMRLTGAGLIGTFAGLLSAHWLPSDRAKCACVLLGALLISVAASDATEEHLGVKDDQRIVIDEWVGYLASVAFLPQTPWVLGLGFILFRLVDTFKPVGINRFASLPGGWGIVMDDVAGGILVNALLHLLPLY